MNSESGLKYFAAVLLLLQLVSTVTVWLLNPANAISEELFALFTAVNLVAFALFSYTYRTEGKGGVARTTYVLAGLVMIGLLLVVSMFV